MAVKRNKLFYKSSYGNSSFGVTDTLWFGLFNRRIPDVLVSDTHCYRNILQHELHHVEADYNNLLLFCFAACSTTRISDSTMELKLFTYSLSDQSQFTPRSVAVVVRWLFIQIWNFYQKELETDTTKHFIIQYANMRLHHLFFYNTGSVSAALYPYA